MASTAKAEIGRRVIAALEQIVADPKTTPAKRREAEKNLAIWKAARESA